MFNIYRKLAVICVLLVLLFAATAVQAQDKDQVVQSMKDRHPGLQQAKDQGLVGEAWNGLVAVVQDDVPQEIQELVQAENKDRKQLFKIISQETGTSVQEVARQNRIRMYRLAKDDHFLQDQDRNWVRKKEL
ncbi:MAG: YdbL family protein [Desulfohalobiaceae bacterium]